MYCYCDGGKRVYVLKGDVAGKFMENVHPAKFSPEDVFSKHRILIKKRNNLFPFND